MDKGTFGVHKIEFVVKSGPCFSDGCGVGQHAHSTLYLSKVSTRNNSRGLVVDSNLETSRTPVNKLDGTLGLDGGNSSIDILGYDITTV